MYCNRDLSWLNFNNRILVEAEKNNIPLFERMKFLSIFSSNLDEFFSVRFPVVMAIHNLKPKTKRKIENETADNTLEQIQVEIERQINYFDEILEKQILPGLNDNGIVLYYKQPLAALHANEAREIFLSKVLSFVQPVLLSGNIAGKFEPEANKLYMLVSMQKEGSDEVEHAMIKVPSDSLGRFFTLSPIGGKKYVVFIDDVIRENVSYVFPGFTVVGIYNVKFNRNADLDFEGDYPGNILKKIEKKLAERKHGAPSRFLFERGMPRNVQLFLASVFGVGLDSIFESSRYQNLKDVADVPHFGKDLTYEEWKPVSKVMLSDARNVFRLVEQRDVLFHFPYHSYNSILAFFNQAAIDPDVREIYIALYRIADDSLVANALISAARNGKKVTAFIELKARFDEANNIYWSRRMEQAGINIIYSIPEIKVHSKIALVRKNDGQEDRSYAVVSTGNFNEVTAHVYTDHTLLTSDPKVGAELLTLFHFLEKREQPGDYKLGFGRLLVAKFNMVDRFEQLIEKEIGRSKSDGGGLIRVKINNLEEPRMIELLCRAAREGVDVRLIVRSICCLVPDEDLMGRLIIKRVVGRYLEHTRLFIFGDNDDPDIIMGSADWMTRNLYHRIEVCTTVSDEECRKELLDYFELQWNNMPQEYEEPVPEYDAQLSVYTYLKDKL